jgi:hypothetical protein
MNKDDSPTVIPADYIFLVIISTKSIINKLLKILNKNGTKKYVCVPIDTTIAETIDQQLVKKIFNVSNKYIHFDEGVEIAQCHIFSEDYIKNYMIIELENNDTSINVSYPILSLNDEADPEELINDWVKKNNISSLAKNINVKPIHIVGINHDILVFSAYINK